MNTTTQPYQPTDDQTISAKPQLHAYIDELEAALPQWQCRRCEFDGCRAYAVAIANLASPAPINRCPPGGLAVLNRLAAIRQTHTGQSPAPDEGQINPTLKTASADALSVATIVAEDCVGCQRCLKVCPTDTIIGGRRVVHEVLSDGCTGCGDCLPVCPVDCITLTPAAPWQPPDDRQARWLQAAQGRRLRLHNAVMEGKTDKLPKPIRKVPRAPLRTLKEPIATAYNPAATPHAPNPVFTSSPPSSPAPVAKPSPIATADWIHKQIAAAQNRAAQSFNRHSLNHH